MITPNDIQKAIDEFVNSLPSGLKALKHDFEAHFRQFLCSYLENLALTTREEFETQSKVLAKTRLKIEELEERLRALEKAG